MKHRVTIIGAGKAGSAVARALRAGGATFDAVISPNISHARSLAKELDCKFASTAIIPIPTTTSLLILAVPDKEITNLAKRILLTPNPSPLTPVTAVHLSGALTRKALAPLATKGARTLALHPAFPFTSRAISASRITNIGWGVDCAPRDWKFAKALVHSLHGEPVRIPTSKRMAYHAACALISNYTMTLAETAVKLGMEIGLSRREAESVLYPALETTVKSILGTRGTPLRKRLTGPVSRGEMQTVEKHLGALSRNREIKALYEALVKQTLHLLKHHA